MEHFVQLAWTFTQQGRRDFPAAPFPAIPMSSIGTLGREGSTGLNLPTIPSRDNPAQGIPVWEPLPMSELEKMARRLAEPVADYLTGRGRESPLLRAFRWIDGPRQRLLTGLCMERQRKGLLRQFHFQIPDVRLFLFDTGIGILTIRMELTQVWRWDRKPAGSLDRNAPDSKGPPELEDIVAFNYAARVLQEGHAPKFWNQDRAKAWERRNPGNPGDDPRRQDPGFPGRIERGEEFYLREFIDWTLSGLRASVEAVGGRFQQIGNPRMVGQTFVRLDPKDGVQSQPDDVLFQHLFRLRRFYDLVYHPSRKAWDPTDNSEVYWPFEQIIHGVSIEGMASMILDDGKTEFFNEMRHRVEVNYFTLFLLTLHQRVALEYLAMCASQFPDIRDRGRLGALGEDILQRCRDLREAAFHFTLHHTFPWVGAATMYQEIYERLVRAMRIEALDNDLREDLQELDELLARMDRERKEARERQAERRRRGIEIAISLLFPVTLLLSFWGSNFREVVQADQSTTGLLDPAALVSYGVTLGLMAAMWLWLRHRPDHARRR